MVTFYSFVYLLIVSYYLQCWGLNPGTSHTPGPFYLLILLSELGSVRVSPSRRRRVLLTHSAGWLFQIRVWMHCLEIISVKNKGTPHPYEDWHSHLFWIICSCDKSLWKKSTWIWYKIHVSLWKCIVYNFIHSFIIKDFVRKYLPLKRWKDCTSKDLCVLEGTAAKPSVIAQPCLHPP